MPERLALCDLGAPGWGEPWFPHSAVLLLSLTDLEYSMAMFVFGCSFLLFLPPYQYYDVTLLKKDESLISPNKNL